MAGLWPRTGNVTVTNGSKIVTGFGTKWKTGTLPIQKGHTFYGPDNFAYEVDTVVSDESLTLVEAYRGGTLANQGYRIDISRTSTISQFAADLASLVAKYRAWFDGMMTWLTGSGDVAILNPDTGANVTIPSWKKVASEGEGQTARAKVEADRAKTEADRAFTEADRAAGIVATAALPLPDVWAPLSDSLRLITGYGRDVVVGADVVARMVNFSRNSTATYIGKDGQLKTAAANEPRFEKEGLLLEGQSQNIFIASDAITAPSAAAVSTSVVTDEGIAALTSVISKTKVVRAIQTVNAPGNTITLQSSVFVAGKTYTASVWCRTDAGASIQFRLQPNGLSPAPIVVTGDKWVRRSVTFTIPADYSSAGGLLFSINQGEYLGIPLYFTGLQVEELPFASSYIPTAGAAVTRAADVCDIPQAELNYRPAYNGRGPMTVAINFDVIGSHTDSRVLVTAETSGGTVSTHSLFAENSGAYSVSIGVRSIPAASTRVAKYIMDPSNNTVSVDGKSYVPYSGLTSAYQIRPNLSIGRRGISNGNFLFGHVRNLRIYFAKLSDEQFKAVT